MNENVNNEVLEMVEDLPSTNIGGNGNVIKTVGIVGAGIGVGVLAYKKLVKPAIKKFKEHRQNKDKYVEIVPEAVHTVEVEVERKEA